MAARWGRGALWLTKGKKNALYGSGKQEEKLPPNVAAMVPGTL